MGDEPASYVVLTGDKEKMTISSSAFNLSGTFRDFKLCLNPDPNSPAHCLPTNNVSSATMTNIITYLEHTADLIADYADHGDDLKESDAKYAGWNKRFLEALTWQQVSALFAAANYLNIPGLLDILARHVAALIDEKPNGSDIRESLPPPVIR